jgi:hypothetical protein
MILPVDTRVIVASLYPGFPIAIPMDLSNPGFPSWFPSQYRLRLYILVLSWIRLFRPFRPERLRQPKEVASSALTRKGSQGKIAKVWTEVNPNMHSEEVLGALGDMK